MSPQSNGFETLWGQLSQQQLAALAVNPATMAASEPADITVFTISEAADTAAFTGSANTANLAITTHNVARADPGYFSISPKNSLYNLSSIATHGAAMADLTRDEINAKLENVELKAENRFVELSGKIDRIVNSIAALNKAVTNELEGVKRELTVVKTDNKFSRLTIIISIVGSVLAGLAVLYVTQANLLAAFQTGLSLRIEQPSSVAPTPPQPTNPPRGSSR